MDDEERELAELRQLIGDADLERLRPTSSAATGSSPSNMLAQFAPAPPTQSSRPFTGRRESPRRIIPESRWSADRSARKSARGPLSPPGQYISRRAALDEYHKELADHAKMLETEKMMVTGGMSKAMFIAGDHALVMQDELPFRPSPSASLVRAARGVAEEPVYSSFAPLTSQGLAVHDRMQQQPSPPAHAQQYQQSTSPSQPQPPQQQLRRRSPMGGGVRPMSSRAFNGGNAFVDAALNGAGAMVADGVGVRGKGEMQAEGDGAHDVPLAQRRGAGRAQTSRPHDGPSRYRNVRSSGYGQTSRAAQPKPRPFVGPGWDASPARSVPYTLRGSKPVTNEPWAADEAVNRNADLEKRGTLDTPLERAAGGGKVTPPPSGRPGAASKAKKKNRATWDSSKTTTFESRPAWDNSKTTAWDVSVVQDRVARSQLY